MPTRDEHEYERRRAQILDGALQVFSTKGFAEATIKDIASAAGIGSPGLIYHYFKDKEDVFRELVERRVPVFDLLANADALMAVPPRQVLTMLAGALLAAADNPATLALMKLMLGESMRRPDVAATLNAVGPGRGFAFLRAYLAAQMETGVLRRMEPGIAARSFIGPFVIYLLSREVFVQPDSATLTSNAMVAGAVETFLRGMAPREPEGGL
jgi:AcrR family transcriptional regulator